MVKEAATSPLDAAVVAQEPGSALRRTLGPWQLTLIGVSNAVGAGVLVLAGIMAANYAGPAATLSFGVAGIVCLLVALFYAELAAMLPERGAPIPMPRQVIIATSLVLQACTTTGGTAPPSADSAATVDELAEQLIRSLITHDPTAAYSLGLKAETHRSWPDRSPAAVLAAHSDNSQLLAKAESINADNLPTATSRMKYAILLNILRTYDQSRVCRSELWAHISHMDGFHLGVVRVAREQPVASLDEREQALQRWRSLGRRAEQEIANSQLGLSLGYSSPKPVVRKVIRQLEELVSSAPEKSPLYSPAERSNDAEFKTEFSRTVEGPVRDALKTFLSYLRQDYLPHARESLGISAHPNGAECYRASLRRYTTLDRAPEEVFRLGHATLAHNTEFVLELGRKKFGTDHLPTIINRINEATDNRFGSEEELVEFSRKAVTRSHRKSVPLFLFMPTQGLRVEPFPDFQRGSGVSSYYQRSADKDTPALYRIASEAWQRETRGAAEVAAVHEGYPGHHLQVAYASVLGRGPLFILGANSAYNEGWARYSELLSEEAEIYETDYALMTRRLWPARGMIADPGLHLYGWSRERVLGFLRLSGRFGGVEGDDMVDRMAIWPGQLTAYDTGALEILALREAAQRELGDRFDVKEFHERVLENGSIPLGVLRAHVLSWIKAARAEPRGNALFAKPARFSEAQRF